MDRSELRGSDARGDRVCDTKSGGDEPSLIETCDVKGCGEPIYIGHTLRDVTGRGRSVFVQVCQRHDQYVSVANAAARKVRRGEFVAIQFEGPLSVPKGSEKIDAE